MEPAESSSTFRVVGQTLDSKPLLEGPAEQIDLLLKVPHLDHPTDTTDCDEGLVRVARDGMDSVPGFHEKLLKFGAIHGHVVHGGVKRPNDKIPVCQGETQKDRRVQGVATPGTLLSAVFVVYNLVTLLTQHLQKYTTNIQRPPFASEKKPALPHVN